jgi:hypothetical protein
VPHKEQQKGKRRIEGEAREERKGGKKGRKEAKNRSRR